MSNPLSSVGFVDLWVASFLKRVIEGGTQIGRGIHQSSIQIKKISLIHGA
jgi:hypothetical protein